MDSIMFAALGRKFFKRRVSPQDDAREKRLHHDNLVTKTTSSKRVGELILSYTSVGAECESEAVRWELLNKLATLTPSMSVGELQWFAKVLFRSGYDDQLKVVLERGLREYPDSFILLRIRAMATIRPAFTGFAPSSEFLRHQLLCNWREVLRVDPKSFSAEFLCKYLEGGREKALQDLTKRLHKVGQPSLVSTRMIVHLGQLLRRLDDQPAEIAVYDAVEFPTDPSDLKGEAPTIILFQRAQAKLLQQDIAGAWDDIIQYRLLRPNSMKTANLIGELCAASSDISEISDYIDLLSQGELETAADVALKKANFAGSVEFFNYCVERYPQSVQLLRCRLLDLLRTEEQSSERLRDDIRQQFRHNGSSKDDDREIRSHDHELDNETVIRMRVGELIESYKSVDTETDSEPRRRKLLDDLVRLTPVMTAEELQWVAKVLFRSGYDDQLKVVLERGLRDYPDSLGLLRIRAMATIRPAFTGFAPSSEFLRHQLLCNWREVLRVDPKSFSAEFLCKYLEGGREKALQDLTKRLHKVGQPSLVSTRMIVHLGQLLRRLDDQPAEIAVYDAVEFPTDPSDLKGEAPTIILFQRAQAKLLQQDIAGAWDDIIQYRLLRPNSMKTANLIGELCAASSDISEISDYIDLLSQGELETAADVALKKANFAGSVEFFKYCVERYPQSGQLLRCRLLDLLRTEGQSSERLGDDIRQQLLDCSSALLKVDPGSFLGRFVEGILTGEPKKAVMAITEHLQTSGPIDKAMERLLVWLGRLCRRYDQFDAEIAVYDAVEFPTDLSDLKGDAPTTILFRRAQAKLLQQDIAGAWDDISHYRVLRPNSTKTAQLIAEFFVATPDIADVNHYWDALSQAELETTADLALKKTKLAEADQFFHFCVERYPQSVQLLRCRLSNLLRIEGQSFEPLDDDIRQQLLDYSSALLKVDPGSFLGRFVESILTGEPKKAVMAITEHLKTSGPIDKAMERLLVWLGRLCRRCDQFDAEIAVYDAVEFPTDLSDPKGDAPTTILFRRAQAKLLQQDIAGAWDDISHYRVLRPNSTKTAQLIAELFVATPDIAEISDYIDLFSQGEIETAADIALKKAKFTGSAEFFNYFIERYPHSVQLLRGRLLNLLRIEGQRSEQLDEDVQKLFLSYSTELLQVDPSSFLGRFVESLLTGEPKKAVSAIVEHLQTYGPIDKSMELLIVRLGRLCRRYDQFDAEIAVYDAVQLPKDLHDPSGANILLKRAGLKVKRRRFENARADLEHHRKLRPDHRVANNILIQSYMGERNYEVAEALCRRLIEADRSDVKVWNSFFRILAIQRDNAVARVVLEEVRHDSIFSRLDLMRFADSAWQDDIVLDEINAGLTNAEHDEEFDDVLAFAVNFFYKRDRWGEALKLIHDHRARIKNSPAINSVESKITVLLETVGVPIGDVLADPKAYRNSVLIASHVFANAPPRRARDTTRPLRVAMVISSLGPGGAQRQCTVLSRELAEHARKTGTHELKVFCTSLSRGESDAFYLPSMQEAGVEVAEYYDWSRSSNTKALVEDNAALLPLTMIEPSYRREVTLQLHKALADYRPDIIHCWLDETLIIGAQVGCLLPEARIVGRWGSLPPTVQRDSTPYELGRTNYFRSVYQAMTNVPFIQFSSNARLTADFYADWIGIALDRVTSVPNGVDFSAFSQNTQARCQIRKELGIAQEAFVIGTAIRLSEEKRPLLWLDIADRVAQQVPNIAFIVVGTGPLDGQVAEANEKLSNTRVHLVGRQSSMSDWYSAFDAVMMTSSVEGMSNTVVEASYMGLPVLAFDVGGMKEAVEHRKSGFLALPDDDVALERHAIELATDSDMCQRMSEQAHRHAIERFDPKRLMRDVLALYERAFS